MDRIESYSSSATKEKKRFENLLKNFLSEKYIDTVLNEQ